jgi:hypothetical protein
MARTRKKGAHVARVSTADFMAATEQALRMLFGRTPMGKLSAKVATTLLFPQRGKQKARPSKRNLNAARNVAKQALNNSEAIDLGNGVQYIPPKKRPKS